MNGCKFCKSLQNYKQIYATFNKQGEGDGLLHEYTVALVIHSYFKGHKVHAGRSTDYRVRGLGYKLNFCPECGRKL